VTRVDFYVLPDGAPSGRERFVCRLADIAYRRGQRVYIHTQSKDQAKVLDNLLWTFQAGSFIPHNLHPSDLTKVTPILIGHDDVPESSHEVLINLAHTVPNFFSRFERVAEVVNQDAVIKHEGRERFRFYRDRGYALETHTLTAQMDDA
jgi:DNA polymerase III subunit chi